MAPSSASKADIAIGRQKKKQYEPIQTLGRGATGTVKLCRHRPSGQLVALKSIAKPSSGTEEDQRVAEESFWHEVTALRRAGRHENLCGLLDAFETGSKYYLVLDYCSGGDLFKRIEQGGPFTERTAATVIVTILNALLYLHAHGVVHRDLKPANLLMRDGSDNAALVLVDFGSSFVATKAPRASGVDRKEAMKTIAGTPYYLAPEIVKGKRYTEKVDLWSVGCIAYQLLCGQTPFQNAAGFQQLYARIQKADFDFPENVPISENAKDFIKRLLVVDPEKRPTAREAMAHEWFKEHIPTCYWVGRSADRPCRHLTRSPLPRSSCSSSSTTRPTPGCSRAPPPRT
ncbi:kinase-like domain-containing protein [Hyaloraphidium curvatum]|nr:kinase-like domain-containing protein [Hyaloraphidium curvatum]